MLENSANGNLSSVHFVSCMQSTSGWTASSQRITWGKRAIIELTFQVAIFIGISDFEFRIADFKKRLSSPRWISWFGGVTVESTFAKFEIRNPKFEILKGCNQPSEQRAAPRNVVNEDVFVDGVRAVAINSQSIQYRSSCCRGEVSVRSAAHLCFTKFEI